MQTVGHPGGEVVTRALPITGQLVTLSGSLDVRTATAVRDQLHAAVAGGQGNLIIDMSRVETMDAIGLGVLVGTQRRADQAGRRLVLRETPYRLRRLLRATRLERLLPTEQPPRPEFPPPPVERLRPTGLPRPADLGRPTGGPASSAA
jgi:anti-anti-sigma factor